MVAYGMIELLFLIFFGGGGIGVPLGVPPAPENPLMSQMAPEECLFYTTWSAVAPLEPESNPTEKWMSQPEIQQSWSKFVAAMDSYFENYEGDNANERLFTQSMYLLGKHGLRGSAAFYLKDLELDENFQPFFTGAGIIDLGENADLFGEQISESILGLAEEFELRLNEFSVGDSKAYEFQFPDTPQVISWTIHQSRYVLVGFGRDSLPELLSNLETPAPGWLQQTREQLEIDRFSSITYVDGQKLSELVDNMPNASDLEFVIDLLGLDCLDHIAWTSGIDEQGFMVRTEVGLNGPVQGIFDVIDTRPLNAASIAKIPDAKTFSVATRLSTRKLFELVSDFASLEPGMDWDRNIEELNEAADIDFEGQVIEQLADYVYLYGTITPINPTSGWVLSVGVKNEMVVDEPYHNIVDLIRDSADGMAEVQESDVNGFTIYSYVTREGFTPLEPSWCFGEGEILFSMDKTSLRRHMRRSSDEDDRWTSNAQIQQMMQPLADGERGPFLISSVDVGQLIELVMSFRDFMVPPGADGELIPGTDFTIDDLPDVKVITNGLTPHYSAAYRTENGFQMIQRQTLPGGSPGGIAGTVFLGAGPAIFTARRSAVRVEAMNQMRQVVLAMHNYHDAYRALPAQYSKDADGNPLLSWRVHILPFIEGMDLYEQFHLDEPWDSEHNLSLLDQMPDVYKHPTLRLEDGKTVYVVPIGEGGLFDAPDETVEDTDSPTGISLEQITDGTSRTIMLIEVSEEHAVEWTKPTDFSWEDVMVIKDALHEDRGGGYRAAFADGSIQTLKTDVTEEVLEKLLKRNDGEVIRPEDY